MAQPPAAEDFRTAELFGLGLSKHITPRQRARMIARAPLPAIQAAALRHPEPLTRRWMLYFLDHYFNDASTGTFADALHDPEPVVRAMALHSIACEPCKEGDLCVADVIPNLIDTLENDPAAQLRIACLLELMQLAARDPRVTPALKHAARNDPDPLVRHCATEALAGRMVRPRKIYERSQRRHASTRPKPRQ